MITYEDKVALNENADIANINKVTAGDMNEIKQVVNSLANLFFPIKKVVIFNDNDDHSNYLDFTWERIASGKMLVGIDSADTDFNTIGKTGGEKEHTLTIDEMPSHSHDMDEEAFGGGGYKNKMGIRQDGGGSSHLVPQYAQTTGYSTYKPTDTGGGQAHNNMPPYQVVALWQRIS